MPYRVENHERGLIYIRLVLFLAIDALILWGINGKTGSFPPVIILLNLFAFLLFMSLLILLKLRGKWKSFDVLLVLSDIFFIWVMFLSSRLTVNPALSGILSSISCFYFFPVIILPIYRNDLKNLKLTLFLISGTFLIMFLFFQARPMLFNGRIKLDIILNESVKAFFIISCSLLSFFIIKNSKEAMRNNITNALKLKEAIFRAQKSARAKSDFLANMSHELRTPLNGVIGMIDLLLSSDLNPEQYEYAETVRISGETLLSIINEILDFSKIEAGKLKMDSIPFNLNSRIESVVNSFALAAREKGIRINLNIDDKISSSLIGDPERIRQVLFNLIGNAVKFTKKGSVTINILRTGKTDSIDYLKFEVRDTGIGIKENDIPIIFDKFTQLDSSMTRRHGGTGLGLAISQRLISMMGGELKVESKKSSGSTFSFLLPLLIDKNEKKEDKTTPPALSGKIPVKDRIEILLVEDNKINQKVISQLLNILNCNVDIAKNGIKAIKKSQTKKYHIIFMDCQMPEMDGLEAAREIRRNESGTSRHVPIIALTGHVMPGDIKRFLDAGMDDYLSKPTRQVDLKNMIEKWGSYTQTPGY